jgi:Head domain of trimeric autotransporter adhesin
MKKITGLLIYILLLQHFSANAQSFAINTTGAAAHASAILDVTSINKGLLIPRLTTAQRTSIASPGKGLLVYDSTLKSFYFHDGVNWQQIIIDSNNLWRKNGNDIYKNNTGNVGIGISIPKSLLNVRGGTVLFDSTIGGTPVSGAGTRMMWIPAKAAFRAGKVTGTQWDDVNIGFNSMALGYNTTASGGESTALGYATTASGPSSIATGHGTIASGNKASAMGSFSTASGEGSIALGYNNDADGYGSVAIGWGSTAGNHGTIAMGVGSAANGYHASAFGFSTTASGDYSTTMGYGTKSKSFRGFTVGTFNDSSNAVNPTGIDFLNRVFQIGNGLADNIRSNAMTVLQNGNIGIGEVNPAYPLNFAATLGDKISIWGNGANHYGFGIQPSLLQIYSDIVGSDIAFGYGNSSSFTERMRVKGNGNVGIGVDPFAKLQVAGLETSAHGLLAAIQLNNTASANAWKIRAGATGTTTPADGFSIGDNTAYRFVITSAGNVGIGNTAPASTLDVTGTTTTDGLQVSNGTVITKMQSGSVTVGSSGNSQLNYTINFPVAFASATPRVFATARNEPLSSFNDSYSVSIRFVTATFVQLNIQRTDANTGWGQQLRVDWFAVE